MSHCRRVIPDNSPSQIGTDKNLHCPMAESDGNASLQTSTTAVKPQIGHVLPVDGDADIISKIESTVFEPAEYDQSSSAATEIYEGKRDIDVEVLIGSCVPGGSSAFPVDPELYNIKASELKINLKVCMDCSGNVQDVEFDLIGGEDKQIDLGQRISESLDLNVSLGEQSANDAHQSKNPNSHGCAIAIRKENENGIFSETEGKDSEVTSSCSNCHSDAEIIKSSSFNSRRSNHSTHGCSICAEFHEFVHNYLMTGNNEGGGGGEDCRSLALNQLLAMMEVKLSQTASTSAEIIAAKSLLELEVSELKTELLYQRNSILWPPSTAVPSELFKECSRLRWRVFELEKTQRTESVDDNSANDDIPSAYEISVNTSEPFSAQSSARKRGHKIRRSISGLQRTSQSPCTPSSPPSTSSSFNSPSSSPSSSSFPSMAATFLSLQSIWNYRLSSVSSNKEQSDLADKARLTSRYSIRKKHGMQSADDRGNTENAKLEVQVPSDAIKLQEVLGAQERLQTRVAQEEVTGAIQDEQVDRDRQAEEEEQEKHIKMEKEKEKEKECLERKRLQTVKEKLKRNLRERIIRKKSQADQFEMDIKEKEKRKSDRAYALYVDALMGKVNELIVIHDQKERDFSVLVEELEDTVRRLALDLQRANSRAPLVQCSLGREDVWEGERQGQGCEDIYPVCVEGSTSDHARYRTPRGAVCHIDDRGHDNRREGESHGSKTFYTPSVVKNKKNQISDFASPTKTDSSYSTDSNDDSDLGCFLELNARNLKDIRSMDPDMTALLCSASISSATTSPAVSSPSASPFDENRYDAEYGTRGPEPLSAILTGGVDP